MFAEIITIGDELLIGQVVLMTGGLGPTKDDITKQTLCKYFHTRLVFSEEVFENIKRVLAGKIPMNALNKGQCLSV